jgi:hypothetical protein
MIGGSPLGGRRHAGLSLLLLLSCAPSFAAVEVLASHYRADQPFPEFTPLWTESWSLKDAAGGTVQYAERSMALGGSLHVFLRNGGQEPVEIGDVLLEGVSLTRAIAFSEQTRRRGLHPASIYFAGLSDAERNALIGAGEPVWWRVQPAEVAPNGSAEVIVRLRRRPKANEIGLRIVTEADTIRVSVPVEGHGRGLEGVSFSPGLDRAYLYVRSPSPAEAPGRVEMDGLDFTDTWSLGHDPEIDLTAIEIGLNRPLERGSFHTFQVVYADGSVASAGLRAWQDDVCYGVWGSRPGDEGDNELAEAYLRDIHAHSINVQMEMVGSAAVREFLKADEGLELCQSLGLRRMVSDPGKGNTQEPYAYFLVDEPDCGDYRVEGLELHQRVGSLAQALVQRSDGFRAADPPTPQLMNVDLTFKPENWYTYGQLPDILAADPYYQERLRSAYWEHPDRLPLYTKATYVYAVGTVCESACAPKPLHLILNSVCHTQPDRKFRYATPAEKRIEVYYALAAGAKGISYWWYTPVRPYVGCGAQNDPGAAALWREIGLLGAEVRTVGPLVVQSCPVRLPVTATPRLWVRTLAVGLDSLLVLVVNDDYANDRLGTVYQPIENAEVSLDLPKWLSPADAFEVTCRGLGDGTWQAQDGRVGVKLGTVDLTRLIVVTNDTALRRRLQELYDRDLADNVRDLVAGEAGTE